MNASHHRRSLAHWLVDHHDLLVASLALLGIAAHLALRYGTASSEFIANVPLLIVLLGGGIPVLVELAGTLARRELGADVLAGISIVAAFLLDEYLAGAFVVLMLSGGEAIEAAALASASSVLSALARRMPSVAHRTRHGSVVDCLLAEIAVGDELVVFPHEICPVDGVVLAGHGAMDESFLTGEPYHMSKTPGSEVLSGALNGNASLTIQATRCAADSRYAQIMKVMEQSEQYRPRMQRLGDQLGAWYTPVALFVATAAWLVSGDSVRFLAVLVVATPCPLIIAIPVAVIGAISLSARHGVIVKQPIVLEQVGRCRTIIFDKTGTLTYGRPALTEELLAAPHQARDVLQLVASIERYSKHPLAAAILDRARQAGVELVPGEHMSELPGKGLQGRVAGREVKITSRRKLAQEAPHHAAALPPAAPGLECVVLIDGEYAATYRFRDEPRADGASFIRHLGDKHGIERVLLVSGDRASEVHYLAAKVGIETVFAEQSPEQKLAIVRAEMSRAPTIFVGDGINDAPALNTATVGLAFGPGSDITSAAAGAVIMESSLLRVDQFLHIGRRLRTIALQSAVGGMLLSIGGMGLAAAGWLPPVAGALLQEVIDVLAVLNAARVAWSPRDLSDYQTEAPANEAAPTGS